MSCCNKLFIITANLMAVVALVLGIYATVKLSQDSDVSIECDICRTLTNDWDQCESLCE